MSLSEKISFAYKTFLHLIAMNIPYGRLNRAIYRMRGSKIGKNVQITHGVFLEEIYPEFITIGDNVQIGPNVIIVAHDSSSHCIKPEAPLICKKIVIERNVYIGAGSIILPGISIGEYSIIAAGAVVTKDVLPRTIVAGVPARKIGEVVDGIKKYTK